MIKELNQISDKDLRYLCNNPINVFEKLDMYYFRVQITKIGCIALKGSKNYAVSDIDCITNSMFNDIQEFVDKNIEPHREEILKLYGECKIGFFYNPVKKYHKIEYPYEHWFIVSDSDSKMFESDNFVDIIDCACSDIPLIRSINYVPEHLSIDREKLKQLILDYKENRISANNICSTFIDSDLSFSRLPIDSIEGIILRSGKIQYKITVNDTTDILHKSQHKIYRDTILNDFARVYKELNIKIQEDDSYVNKVSNLFLEYINNTDLLSKYSIDPEDILPPHTGYFGNVNFYKVKSDVQSVCKNNKVFENIFRLLLHTFTTSISDNKLKELSSDTRETLSNLIISLKYRNYKQILLNAYLANNQ